MEAFAIRWLPLPGYPPRSCHPADLRLSQPCGIFSFLYENEQVFLDLESESSVPVLDMSEDAYIERSAEFLDIIRNMTDHEKAVAELSNNKVRCSCTLPFTWYPEQQ